METTKEVLCFLNELIFTDDIDRDCLEKLRKVLQKLVIEY